MATSKQCSRCKVVKNSEEFHVNSRSIDGRASWCKSCTKKYRRKGKTPDTLPTRVRTPEFLRARNAWLYEGLMEGYIDANQSRNIEVK